MTKHTERLQRYLDRLGRARQHDHKHIHGFDAGEPTEALLLASDIQAAINQVKELEAQPTVEPVAYLHDDGYWTAAKTEQGRALSDRLHFAGSPKIGVHLHPEPTTNAEPAPVAWCPECRITHDLGACAKASPANALDAKRFRAIFGAAIAGDDAFIDVFNIIVPENDAVTLDLIRDAIDAAMAAQQTQGGVR